MSVVDVVDGPLRASSAIGWLFGDDENFAAFAAGAGGERWPEAAFVARIDLVAIGGKADAAASRPDRRL